MLEYEGGATVSFTMVGCTEPVHKRRTKIFGTLVSDVEFKNNLTASL